MRKFASYQPLKNEQGLLSVEFIFGFFVVFGIMTLLLRLSYTFAVVEVTQYIMFSTSRAYSAAHFSEEKQLEVAQAKYEALALKHPDFSTIYGRGWYTIPEDPVIGHFAQGAKTRPVGPDFGENSSYEGGVAPFIGARIEFQAPVLTYNVPFLGSTTEDDQAFSAGIASFLIREPSMAECQEFMARRIDVIKNLGKFSSLANVNAGAYVPMEDNGC